MNQTSATLSETYLSGIQDLVNEVWTAPTGMETAPSPPAFTRSLSLEGMVASGPPNKAATAWHGVQKHRKT